MIGRRTTDLVGRTFGRLTVLEFSHKGEKNKTFWKCQCCCTSKVIKIYRSDNLVSGDAQSCGCVRRKRVSETHFKHGLTRSRIYNIWVKMRNRCENENNDVYQYYGARGISVCSRWQDFNQFFEDMGPSYDHGMTIERRNNNGNYDENNCYWASRMQQMLNTRRSITIDTPWGRMCATHAARKFGINPATLTFRMKNWPQERWFDPPSRK